jgi:hypothetical protein
VRGKFITFEGIDGAGKSSHLDFACELARARGHSVERTFEPGGTPFGQRLREVVLNHPASALAEALAMLIPPPPRHGRQGGGASATSSMRKNRGSTSACAATTWTARSASPIVST